MGLIFTFFHYLTWAPPEVLPRNVTQHTFEHCIMCLLWWHQHYRDLSRNSNMTGPLTRLKLLPSFGSASSVVESIQATPLSVWIHCSFSRQKLGSLIEQTSMHRARIVACGSKMKPELLNGWWITRNQSQAQITYGHTHLPLISTIGSEQAHSAFWAASFHLQTRSPGNSPKQG